MFLFMSFRALSFPRLAEALKVPQPVKAWFNYAVTYAVSLWPGQFADVDKSFVVLCPTLLINGTRHVGHFEKQHAIGVIGCDYMTAFEQVIVACSAWKIKWVSASSCVDCSSATHSATVILKQVSSQVTYLAAYLCIAVVSTRQPRTRHIRLVEGTAQELSPLLYVVSPCQAIVLKGCACTSV